MESATVITTQPSEALKESESNTKKRKSAHSWRAVGRPE
jgi:hypothetical protein